MFQSQSVIHIFIGYPENQVEAKLLNNSRPTQTRFHKNLYYAYFVNKIRHLFLLIYFREFQVWTNYSPSSETHILHQTLCLTTCHDMNLLGHLHKTVSPPYMDRANVTSIYSRTKSFKQSRLFLVLVY